MKTPKVSIVVPVYNGAALIERCIETLLAQDYPKEFLEIIIVDNNSKDNTAELIKKYPVNYVFEEKQGVCFARNKGLEAASGELLAYTDSDCFANPDWISKLVHNFKDEKVGGVGGHVAPYPAENIIEEYIAYRGILTQEGMFREKENSPPFFITANAMYRTDVLRAIGGFDNFFKVAGEDADLSWRVVEKGYTLKFEKRAVVYHKHRANLKSFLKQMYNYGFGSAAVFKKYHKKFKKKYWIQGIIYKHLLIELFYMPIEFLGNKNKFGKYVFMLDFISNIVFILGKIKGSIKYKIFVV